MNIAVLIGAGASFGAGGIAPETPPLGCELFDRLQREFPDSWGSLLDDERKAFGGDPPFETGMKMLWENNDERLPRLLIDMAIYFSRFRPDGSPNCYAALLQLLMTTSRIDVFFCSLNYECVFEQIAEQVGLDLINLGRGRREEGRRACLYKPHGSCNYIDRVTRNVRGTFGQTFHSYVYRDHPALTDFEVLNCPDVETLYDTGVTVPPVMSLYEATKHSPVGSTLMNMIREAWAQRAASAEVILAIGARPVLDDDHIWGPVIGSSATVWFVGGREDAYSALEDAMIGGRLQHLASRFDLAIPVLRRRLAPIAS